MSIKQRIRKWFTIDHVVDLCVDILLMIWDVITSPVLIVVRILRHFIGEWFTGKIKAGIRWIAYWFERRRSWRKERGYGIWRTYWMLIILSPIILVCALIAFLVLGLGMEIGGWIFEEIEYEFGEPDDY